MTDTRLLIERLAAQAAPVAPLATPLRRTLLWLGAVLVVVTAVVAWFGLSDAFAQAMRSGPGRLEWAASVATGVLGAYATFQVSVPGRSWRWALLPAPALVAWLAGLSWGCLADAARLGVGAQAFDAGARECAQAIAWTALPIGLLLLVMVRHAGVVRPRLSAALAAVTAAAVSAASVTLYHGGESMLMVLVWHGGAVAVLSLACAALGRPLFAWIGHARRPLAP